MTSQRAQSSNNRGSQSQFTFRLPSMWIVVLVSVLLAAPGVFAQTTVDFYCNASNCTGTVVQSGSNFSTSGISVFNDNGPFASSAPFTLAFNTATGVISIDGTGTDTGLNLIGTIVSFSHFGAGTSAGVTLEADWSTLPAAVAKQLGAPTATDSGFAIFLTKTGVAQSVDILFTPTPEPASMLLVGTGLLAIGGLLRSRRRATS